MFLLAPFPIIERSTVALVCSTAFGAEYIDTHEVYAQKLQFVTGESIFAVQTLPTEYRTTKGRASSETFRTVSFQCLGSQKTSDLYGPPRPPGYRG